MRRLIKCLTAGAVRLCSLWLMVVGGTINPDPIPCIAAVFFWMVADYIEDR